MIAALARSKKISLLGKRRKVLALRGFTGFIALCFYFYAISKLPLATAVVLNYTAPIFTAVLSILFLRERPSLLLISMIAVSFCGVYFLVGVDLKEWNIAVLIGLFSGFFAALSYVLIRFIRYRESPIPVIFYFMSVSTVGSALFLPFEFRWPDALTWLALGGVGLCAFYAQIWLTISLRRAPASLISPFSYLNPLLSFAYGYFFFKEAATFSAVVGALLIISGGSTITYFESRLNRKIPS